MLNYRPIFDYESYGGYNISLKISGVFPHDKLSDDTARKISSLGEQIVSLLRRDAERADKAVMDDIEEEKTELLKLFPEECHHKEIPNGYWNNPNRPWFIVYTVKGPIEIGWRKRVISISWRDSVIEQSAEQLFPDENVTKDGKAIHAWGYEKAKEYIERLLK